MRAGFAEVDITPPVGTHKIGWLRDIVSEEVMDPLSARIAVLEADDVTLAWIQLDTLSIRWTQVNDVRQRIERDCGVPGTNVMIAATHNHGGPAVAHCGDVSRDDEYVEALVGGIVQGFGHAMARLVPVEIGFGRVFEFGLSHNRRIILRNGTSITHGAGFTHPEALCREGPIDPEVAVLAARDGGGRILGAIVNFACHPVHHGGGTALTAGYPGALAAEMGARDCPVTLFLNGASGNISPGNPDFGLNPTMEEIGAKLAEDVALAIEAAAWSPEAELCGASAAVQLPYRVPTDDEIAGTVPGAQRFVDPTVYDRGMPRLVERIRERGTQPAEVQVLSVGELAFAGIPAEYFVQHGLRIKEEAHPLHALVVGHANGMVGYVPTPEAFDRGGYETTFAGSSRLAPQAGDILADTAIELIRSGR